MRNEAARSSSIAVTPGVSNELCFHVRVVMAESALTRAELPSAARTKMLAKWGSGEKMPRRQLHLRLVGRLLSDGSDRQTTL